MAQSAEKPHSILAIDEEEDLLYFLKKIFENFKTVRFHYASNPLMAIRMAQEVKPDLVIMEIYFPRSDHFDAAYVLRRIRELRPGVKIIVSSTISDEGIVRRSLRELRVQGYFSKPYPIEVLVKKSLELLGLAQG